MSSPDTFKIYCGNLSPMTTGPDLQTLFSKYGTVVEADVIAGKNFGFVHMANEQEGANALTTLQGHLLNGEKLVVQRAINSKRASTSTMGIKRPNVGQGIGSLDDFESVYEINDNLYNHESPNVFKLQQSVSTSSPSHYSLPINSSLSNNSSGRPSPLLLSSGSSTSYTPEHVLQHPRIGDNKININSLSLMEENYCGMCSEEFNNLIHVPKILSCNHTFCSDCLMSLAKGPEIKCPMGCRYITTLQDSGVSGLTTNQTKIYSHDDDETLTCTAPFQDNHTNQQSFEQDVCCVCLCTPPGKLCAIQKHQTAKQSDAFKLMKIQLGNILKLSMNTLRTVMTIQATLKDRMQYTLHSLNKFSEELKLKIEGEELEQKIQQSLLYDLHELTDTLGNITNIKDLLQRYSKVNSSYQNITSKFRHCYAKDSVNSALQSIVLELKDPLPETGLNQYGLSHKEAFSLASSLKDNADKGNFANVLLIYLLSDLLFTRYRPVVNPSFGFSHYSHSFGSVNTPSLSPLHEPLQDSEVHEQVLQDTPEMFDINKVIEMTKAIESNVVVNGSSHAHDQDRFSPPVVSSALSLGLSNFTLIGSSNNKSSNDEYENNNGEEEKEDAPRPVSYLDAVKKPAKPSNNNDSQSKQITKTAVPPSLKPNVKFPHCWMVLSINGATAGRIIFQLRPDKAPNMCDNFVGLCTGRSGYGYKGTHFFKNGDGFLVGGDVENDDGSGGYSVYDKQKFEADLCPLKDDVGMVRFKGIGTSDKGRGMVGSQFMVWYTEREFKKFSFSLVFGKVVDGLDIIQEAANHNLHKVAIKVEECGAI